MFNSPINEKSFRNYANLLPLEKPKRKDENSVLPIFRTYDQALSSSSII
jgi:hypothetical protein